MSSNIDFVKKYINNKNLLVLCDSGYGDGGKAKIADFFLQTKLFKNFVKTAGGNNSGNTNGKGIVFNSLPIGVYHSSVRSYLGGGALLNPFDILEEIKDFEKNVKKIKNFKISGRCPLILPHHITLDILLNSSKEKNSIGSTSKGIGPAYSDFIQRKSLLTKDLLLPEKELKEKISIIKKYYQTLGGKIKINEKELLKNLKKTKNKISKYIGGASKELNKNLLKKEKALLMSGQGFDLSVRFGKYPFVTSSDCSVYGSLQGSAISHDFKAEVLNIFQFPLVTKVGGGDLENEIGGTKSKVYCANAKINLKYELEKYDVPYTIENKKIIYDKRHRNILNLLKSKDEFKFSVGLRLNKRNYGVTSGRPRRFGWCSLDTLNRAININGGNICLTKIDFLNDISHLKFFIGDKCFNFNLEEIDFKKINKFSDFPISLKKAFKLIETKTNKKIILISIGPKVDDVIYK